MRKVFVFGFLIFLLGLLVMLFGFNFDNINDLSKAINKKMDTVKNHYMPTKPPNSNYRDSNPYKTNNSFCIGNLIESPCQEITRPMDFSLKFLNLTNLEIKQLLNTTDENIFIFRHLNITESLNTFIKKIDLTKTIQISDQGCFLKEFVTFLINENFFIMLNNDDASVNPKYAYKSLETDDFFCDEPKTTSDTKKFKLSDDYYQFYMNNTSIYNFLPIESLNITNDQFKNINGNHQFKEIDVNSIIKIKEIMKKKYIKKIFINDIFDGEIKKTVLESAMCYSYVNEDFKEENNIILYRNDDYNLLINFEYMHLYFNNNVQSTLFEDVKDLVLDNFQNCANPISAQPYSINSDSTYICCHIIAHLKTFFSFVLKDLFKKNSEIFKIINNNNLTLCQEDPKNYLTEQSNIWENFHEIEKIYQALIEEFKGKLIIEIEKLLQ
ncbi:hypothetical protein GVAV_000878 [Gurleya vavrai]